MKRFNFLICSERSGSNFITSLMNGHSRICGPPPTHLFRLFATNRGHYGDLGRDANWQALAEDMVLSFDAKLGHWSTSATVADLLEGVRERSAAVLLRRLYEREAEHDRADQLFVKENHTYRFAPFLLAHFPGCRFVWMTRDPRDVASSWVSTESIPGGVARAIEIWLADQVASRELCGQLYDSGRIIRVRYEDLVGDTEASLERLTAFLELSYEPEMLRFHQHRRTAENARRIDAWVNLGQPVIKGNIGKYRATLSPADQRYVELACHEPMTFAGYDPELVLELPDADAVGAELEALRPSLDPGGYAIPTVAEQEIRARRLAAIDRVLSRRPKP